MKNCLKKSKNNPKVVKMPVTEKNQNTILKYFHPIASPINESSKITNKKFSTNFNDHDCSQIVDISSSPSDQSSNTIKSKYFIDKIIQAPYPNTLLVNRNK
jgi:hypothetical protein